MVLRVRDNKTQSSFSEMTTCTKDGEVIPCPPDEKEEPWYKNTVLVAVMGIIAFTILMIWVSKYA